ncbi:hypothetical protein REPUB_Repub04eG0188000 [Reevesia pubescens]
MHESEKSSSACAKVEKHIEARQEEERKFDVQYQRKIAEGLDNHLTAVQQDHELKSQIEERRIWNDAAHEEAKRMEKAIQEGLHQEKAKAEAELKFSFVRCRLNLKLRKPNRVALEAPRRHSEVSQTEALAGPKATSLGVSNAEPKRSEIDETNNSNSAGKMLRTAENALNLERESLQKLKELDERNQSLRLSSNEDFGSTERHIARLIRQIRGTTNNVSKKAEELIKIFNNPHCPLTISIAFFAKKVVSNFDSADNAAFAYGYVIILVTSKMAGFALFRKYKSQFMKVLNIISENFLNALRAEEDLELRCNMHEIQSYFTDKLFLEEPEGRALQSSLLSNVFVPTNPDYQHSYQPSRYYSD